MPFRKLIFSLLVIIGLLFPASMSAATECQSPKESVSQTDNRPQWQDIGMNDVLAVTNGSTVAPPTTVRVVHDSPSGWGRTYGCSVIRMFGHSETPALKHTRTVSGYIYLIRCLRL